MIAKLGNAAVLILALTGAAAAQETGPCLDGAPAGEAVLVQAVETAGIVRLASGREVLLAGVTAPRVSSGAAAEDAFAEAAVEFLKELLSAGQARFIPLMDDDRYGRRRGDLLVDRDGSEVSAREALLAEGHAKVVRPPGEPACRTWLMRVERAALEARKGIWASADHGVLKAADPSLGARTGLYEVVEGRVVSVGGRSYMTFLDFGPDYRRDFTVMLTPAVVEELLAVGIEPTALVGAHVRVRGVIERSGGPAIRLVEPEELVVLGGRAVNE